MSATRTVSRWLLWISVALMASPGLAAAQNAVLYEVTEAMKIRGRGVGSRDAKAALMGTVKAGSALCPKDFGVEHCSIVAEGVSRVDLRTGKGSLGGRFAVVVQDTNPVDGDEWVIATGNFVARIDLSPAIFGPDRFPDTGDEVPLGTLDAGTWSARGENGGPLSGRRMEGNVQGVFRLPFVFGLPNGCLDDNDPSDCGYVSNASYWTDAGPVDVKWNEMSLGTPTVRLDLWFTETYDVSRSRRGRNGDRN